MFRSEIQTPDFLHSIINMDIHKADFVGSFTQLHDCPKPDRPEYAFIGRSNVGKSSLINMLCDRRSLAKTSSQPGKTQTMNYFSIDNQWYLVDLPGYGYARIAERTRQFWKQMIERYMIQRPNLQCAFLLIDSRIPPQKIDLEFANWMGSKQIPFVLVFTKTDKKKSLKKSTFYSTFKEAFLENWSSLPQYFFTSAKSKVGRSDVLSFIEEINSNYP